MCDHIWLLYNVFQYLLTQFEWFSQVQWSIIEIHWIATTLLWVNCVCLCLSLRTCRLCSVRCVSWCFQWLTGVVSTALLNSDFSWERLSPKLPSSSWVIKVTSFAHVRSPLKVCGTIHIFLLNVLPFSSPASWFFFCSGFHSHSWCWHFRLFIFICKH